ncbi:hypothetical protein D9757_006473 [Collybiopsis confluens]|uniref:Uncharacterized protein n=1 Tax=Collybiopsis confluens TaxID=2823264 RepID=A0A8H5HJI0_9AGAR|nr:hypothetical protein D9757_006473 [Collybiopsis confluens]
MKSRFTKEEDDLLVEFIAKNDLTGLRKEPGLYKKLAEDHGKEYHRTAKAWCHRYSKNSDYFDRLIDTYRRGYGINEHLNSTSESPTRGFYDSNSISFSREEDKKLASFLLENTPTKGLKERTSLKTYRDYVKTQDSPRSAHSLLSRYMSNLAYFETLIEQHLPGNYNTKLRKRKRVDPDADEDVRRKKVGSVTPAYETDHDYEDQPVSPGDDTSRLRAMRDNVHALRSPKARVVRSRGRKSKAEREEDQDVLEVDKFLRQSSLSAADSDSDVSLIEAPVTPIPKLSEPLAAHRSSMNSGRRTRARAKVRFSSIYSSPIALPSTNKSLSTPAIRGFLSAEASRSTTLWPRVRVPAWMPGRIRQSTAHETESTRAGNLSPGNSASPPSPLKRRCPTSGETILAGFGSGRRPVRGPLVKPRRSARLNPSVPVEDDRRRTRSTGAKKSSLNV